MSKATPAQIIVEEMVQLMESGDLPAFRLPFRRGESGDRSVRSGAKPYRGINCIVTALVRMVHGYESSHWITERYAGEMGGSVTGKPTPLAFWKFPTTTDKRKARDAGRRPPQPFMRYYRVYNLDQTEGLDALREKIAKLEGLQAEHAIEVAPTVDAVVTRYFERPNAPALDHRATSAYYVPARDSVHLPAVAAFHTADGHASTAFHEMAHSTGHSSRLNRDGVVNTAKYERHESYADEELVAEFAAAMLCSETGSKGEQRNSAAYIKGWAKQCRQDPRLLVNAAQRAQHAVDYILEGRKAEYSDSE